MELIDYDLLVQILKFDFCTENAIFLHGVYRLGLGIRVWSYMSSDL